MPRLTEVTICNARPGAHDVLLADGGCLLCVRATANNGYTRGWIVRIKRNGKRRVHRIGPCPSVSIKQARAKPARIVAIERGDECVFVQDAAEHYMDAIIRPKYRLVSNAEVYARRLQSRLGDLTVDAVRPVDVSRMIADYSGEAPVAAMRMIGFARQFIACCVAFGYRERSPVADVRPRQRRSPAPRPAGWPARAIRARHERRNAALANGTGD
jgi:uncharacterized UPF0146 family protein